MRAAYLSFLAYALTVLGAPVGDFGAAAQPLGSGFPSFPPAPVAPTDTAAPANPFSEPSGFPGPPFEPTASASSAAPASTSPALSTSSAEVLPTPVADRDDHHGEDPALVGIGVGVGVGVDVKRASSTDSSDPGPTATTAPVPTSTDASSTDASAPEPTSSPGTGSVNAGEDAELEAEVAALLSSLVVFTGNVVNDFAGPNGFLANVTNLIVALTEDSSTGSSGSSGDGANVGVRAGAGVHANVDSVASSGPPPTALIIHLHVLAAMLSVVVAHLHALES